jgi:hypothetical protein
MAFMDLKKVFALLFLGAVLNSSPGAAETKRLLCCLTTKQDSGPEKKVDPKAPAKESADFTVYASCRPGDNVLVVGLEKRLKTVLPKPEPQLIQVTTADEPIKVDWRTSATKCNGKIFVAVFPAGASELANVQALLKKRDPRASLVLYNNLSEWCRTSAVVHHGTAQQSTGGPRLGSFAQDNRSAPAPQAPGGNKSAKQEAMEMNKPRKFVLPRSFDWKACADQVDYNQKPTVVVYELAR